MAAAVWFAATLTTAGDVRRRQPGFVERAKRQLVISLVAGLVAVVSGTFLIFMRGGFAAVPRPYHLAFGLSLIALMAEVQLLVPTLRVLESDATAPKRFVVITALLHFIRTAVFILMVIAH